MAIPNVTHIRENERFAAAEALLASLTAAWQLEREAEQSIIAEIQASATPARPGQAVEWATAVANSAASDWKPPQDLQAKLTECRSRQAVLERGITEQRARVQTLAGELSGDACDGARRTHADAVKAVADAVRALDEANRAEVAVRVAIEAAGYGSSSLPPFFHAPAGWADEVGSSVKQFLHEADHYCRKHDGSLDPARKVTGRATVDLPAHGAKAGEFLELPEDVACDLSRDRAIDLKTRPEDVPNAAPALRSRLGKAVQKVADALADAGEMLT